MSLKQLIKVTVVTEAVKLAKVTKVIEVAKVTEVTKVTEVAAPDFADDAEANRRLTEGHLKAIRKAPEGQ